MNTPITDQQSEIDALRQELAAWRENCRKAEADCSAAIEAREVMARRLEASPGMREVIGELRAIKELLDADTVASREAGEARLTRLLRRLDRE